MIKFIVSLTILVASYAVYEYTSFSAVVFVIFISAYFTGFYFCDFKDEFTLHLNKRKKKETIS